MVTVKTSPRFKPREPWSKDTGKITTQTGDVVSYKKPSYKLVEKVESTLVPTEKLFETTSDFRNIYEINQEGIIPGSAIKHDVSLTKEEMAEPGPLLQKKLKKLSKTAD